MCVNAWQWSQYVCKTRKLKGSEKNILTEGFGGTKKVPQRVIKADKDIFFSQQQFI